MHTSTRRYARFFLSALMLVLAMMAVSSRALAQRSIDDSDRVTKHGNVHPEARPGNDRGSADLDMPMNNMVLSLSVRPEAQAQLNQLLAGQQDPNSPDFHKWLTPQEFGLRFGPGDQDIADVTGWLKKHGFKIEQVAAGRMWINFSGKVKQVEQAFQTNIRQYEVNGKVHHANATDPSIPRALSGIVQGVVSLNDFPKHRNSNVHQLPADFTAANGDHFLAPADFAAIYNLNPLYASGIDGTGQTVAIVGRTNINVADVQFFRSFFGLPVNDPVVLVNGTDPGDLGGNEETEADLDVEWSGAVAKNATIEFVVSASTTSTDGVDLSAQYIVNNNLANVMSTSFGLCEAALGATGNNFWSSLWAQAAAQGITAFVSSGDNGAAGCDDPNSASALGGVAVSGLTSTPNNISVGGTQFDEGTGTYWAAGNNATDQSSALGYIPEITWNESGNVAGGSGLFATGGGASSIYGKPSWQTGPGVLLDGHRDVPDVALSAAGHDGYLIVQGHTPLVSGMTSVGGTSAASPSFAGLMALVVQKTGVAQGNANPIFYSMGRNQQNGGLAVYHDILSGNNTVPGVVGFSSVLGYDPATGWGSVDAASLVNFWNNNPPPSNFSIDVTPSLRTIPQGGSTTYTVTITPQNGYTGTVNFSVTGLPAGTTASFAPASVSISGSALSSTLSITTATTTPTGSFALTVTGTDGTLTHSASATLQTVVPPDFAMSASPSSQTVVQGGSTSYTVTITSLNGYAGTVTLTPSGLPADATATFTPATIVGQGTSTFTITTASTTPAGTYSVTINGTDFNGGPLHAINVTLVVNPAAPPDFSLTAFPASQTIQAGNNAGYGITVGSINGFTGVVSLSVTGLPPNSTGSINPNSITTSGTTTLSVLTTLSTVPGTYTLVIKGVNGTTTHTASVTLVVTPPPPPDFTITPTPSSITIKRGDTGSVSVNIGSQNGFTGNVTVTVAGLPALVTGAFKPNPVTGGSGTSVLTLVVDKKAKAGNYTLTITGTSGGTTHSTTVTLTIV